MTSPSLLRSNILKASSISLLEAIFSLSFTWLQLANEPWWKQMRRLRVWHYSDRALSNPLISHTTLAIDVLPSRQKALVSINRCAQTPRACHTLRKTERSFLLFLPESQIRTGVGLERYSCCAVCVISSSWVPHCADEKESSRSLWRKTDKLFTEHTNMGSLRNPIHVYVDKENCFIINNVIF